MEYTKNYHLPQWAEEDRIQMEDFNDAMASIENGLDTANQTAAAVQEQLGTELSELAAEVGHGGKNARMDWGTYIGNGKFGSNNPTSLSFNFKPIIVLIHEITSSGQVYRTWMQREQTKAKSAAGDAVTISWTDKGVSWYGTVNHGQNNTANATYFWIAIGADE